MKRFFVVAALLVASVFSSSAQAGISGSSLLDISNLKVTIINGPGSPRAATASFDTDATGVDFNIGGSQTTATNKAVLNALSVTKSGGQSILGDTTGGFAGPATDAVLASASSGTNFFNADSSFGGSPLDLSGAFGLTYGGNATTQAAFNIDDPGFLGNSNGNVTNFASIAFNANQNLTAVISFDALVNLALSYTGVPGSLQGFASTSFGVTIVRTSGTPAVITAFAPPVLNSSIKLGAPGNEAFSTPLIPVSSGPIALEQGATYTLTINQTASVLVSTVPEPASLVVMGGLAGLGLVRFRRKK